MDSTAEKGIYVGYNEPSKAYKIYIPAIQKKVVRKDVLFEEKAFRYDMPTIVKDQVEEAPKVEHESQLQGTSVGTVTQDEEQDATSTLVPLLVGG